MVVHHGGVINISVTCQTSVRANVSVIKEINDNNKSIQIFRVLPSRPETEVFAPSLSLTSV